MSKKDTTRWRVERQVRHAPARPARRGRAHHAKANGQIAQQERQEPDTDHVRRCRRDVRAKVDLAKEGGIEGGGERAPGAESKMVRARGERGEARRAHLGREDGQNRGVGDGRAQVAEEQSRP